MEYVAHIKAELSGYPGPEKLVFKQGDFGERYFVVKLLRNGSPIQMGSDMTPRMQMEKPDGCQVFSDNNIEIQDDGTLKIQVTPQMSAAAGQGRIEVGLYKQGALLSTAVIDTLIYPNAMSMVKVASSNEYQVLVDALAQIAPSIEAEKERQAAEAERRQQEEIRQSNESVRQKALEDMTRATEYANQQGDYAKQQGDYAGTQGDYAKEQAGMVETEFGKIEDLLKSSETGEILVRVEQLLDDLYDVATDTDIDRIIDETYVDESDEGNIFESGSPEDIDAIIAGSYMDDPGGDEPVDTVTSNDISNIVDGLFGAA